MSVYPGVAPNSAFTREYDVFDFMIRQALGQMATMSLVRVVAVDTAAKTVDAQPMVAQIDGDGNATPHGVIHGLPYGRIQGGNCALIIDPVVGDIGVCGFMSRDISSVKATKAPGLPGSRRSYDWADGVYVCSVLGGEPTTYITVTPDTVTVKAAMITLDGNARCTGTFTADTDVIGGGKSLKTHTHGGVTTGGGTSGPPS